MNLKDAQIAESFLLVGPGGSGKTTQFRTMPGKKFAWIFDPNALASLRGQDIEYAAFIPDVVGKGLALGGKQEVIKAGNTTSVQVYQEFWNDLRQRISTGYFDGVDSLLLDGLTGLTAVFEEKVLSDLGKPAGELEKREFNLLTREISAALRQITSLGKNLLVIAHRKNIMDQTGTNLKGAEPELVGKSRAVVPTHFSNVFYTTAEGDSSGNVRYFFYTKPSGLIGDARASAAFSHLPGKWEATIKDLDNPGEHGIGKLLKGGK